MRTSVSLSSKGQLTLPSAVRDMLQLKKGDRLQVSMDESQRTITLAPVVGIEELSARISGYAKHGEPVTNVDEYYQSHRRAGSDS